MILFIYLLYILNNNQFVFIYSNGTTGGGKQQAITSGVSKSSQQLVNGNSAAVELYSPKNGGSGAGDGPLLPGNCDLCDGKSVSTYHIL